MTKIMLSGCAQYSVVNSGDIVMPEGTAGHYFIQKALEDNWFAYVNRCDNGAVSVEIIAEEKFISNLDKAGFCELIRGEWNAGSCSFHGKLIYFSPEFDDVAKKPQKIYRFYQKDVMQSCQQWLEAAKSIELNLKGEEKML